MKDVDEKLKPDENGHFMFRRGWKRVYNIMNDNARMLCIWENMQRENCYLWMFFRASTKQPRQQKTRSFAHSMVEFLKSAAEIIVCGIAAAIAAARA